ncbi:MAG: NAD+ synthase [Candidatus Thermoplasmatota archaeon]|nr:NAD+ synthase [Candidatus Thermoplasmatota archaeon]
MKKSELEARYVELIKSFIRAKVKEANAGGAVVGLSGGLDSAVTAKLCIEALGNKNVLLLILPGKITKWDDTKDAIEFAKTWKANYKVIDISKIADNFVLEKATREEYGNIQARVRMILLYFFANKLNYLVVGTGNKSERLVGYFTKYGDGACDILPLGNLYKTQVRELAKGLGIHHKIIAKVPSAGLWKGQTDEKELGISYKKLDMILMKLEKGLSCKEIAKELDLPSREAGRVKKMIESSEHKRALPAIPEVR